jgi:hypothetical protein
MDTISGHDRAAFHFLTAADRAAYVVPSRVFESEIGA